MVTAIKAMRAGEIENKGMPAEMGWSGQASSEVTFALKRRYERYRPRVKLTKEYCRQCKTECRAHRLGRTFHVQSMMA